MNREQKLEEALNTAIYRLCVVENSPNLNSGEKELIRGWIKEGWAALSAPKAEAMEPLGYVRTADLEFLNGRNKGISTHLYTDGGKHMTALYTFPVITDETVERVARAWASIDGKLVEFEDERKSGCSLMEEDTGTYEGYIADAAELLRRAGEVAVDAVAAEPVEMNLCEARRVLLRPGITYRFTVDPACESCCEADRLAAFPSKGDE